MAESIVFRVGADITPLKKGVKGGKQQLKSLGGPAVMAAKSIAKVGAAAAAAGAAIVAMTARSATAAREINNLAKLSGTGAKGFQEMAFAAKSVGIEQDKLADIFKDTQDKVGDFIANGAGPLQDFFDNIGPKVGVAANDFKNLSGPDALGLYVSSLEKANLSQSEMVFYMEAIASDSTQLLPLLKNNGEGMKEFASQSERLGLALTDIEVQQLDNLKGSLDSIGEASGSFFDKLSVQFAPAIDAVSKELLEVIGDMGGMGKVAESVFSGIITGAGYVANAWRGIEIVIKGLEALMKGFSAGALRTFAQVAEGAAELANIIPGVEIEYESTGIAKLAKAFEADFAEAAQEMQDLLLAPLPSEKMDEWAESLKFDSVTHAATQVNQELIANQKQSLDKMADQQENYEEKVSKIKEAWGKQQTQASIGILDNLSVLMQSKNKEMFEIGKKAAQANTLISTYESAQKAYNSLAGIPIVGPALGAAAAAAAVAAGYVRMQAINSTSFGGGGGGGAAAAAGGGGAIQSSVAGAQGGAASSAGQDQTLTVQGLDRNSLYDGDSVRMIAEKLVDFQRDGGQVVIA